MVEKKKEQEPRDPKVEEARAHFKAAHESMHKAFEAMLPPGVAEQRRAARKEILLGLRSMLDSAIDHVEPTTK
jgi:hypothetical protein